jgi:hypothetical protein
VIAKNCKVFGWVVHHVAAASGETFDFRVARETAHARLSAQTLYTKGRILGHYVDDESRPALERVAGFATDSLPNPLPALHLNMVVVNDAEWWCISAPANRSLPSVGFLRIDPGQSVELAVGSRTLVCSGNASLNGAPTTSPVAIRAQSAAVLAATDTPVYAMQFGSEYAAP